MKTPQYLNALKAFEASARHGSFSAAARELGVTSAAVGQLVKSLEDWIKTPLFVRSSTGTSRLVPTEAASNGLPDIGRGFEHLINGLERLKHGVRNSILTVTVSSGFAAKWLLPRIHRFQTKHPEIDVRLDTNAKLQDFDAQGIDIGVRYGLGTWSGLHAEKLMEEEVFPACSPSFLATNNIRSPKQLAGQVLIHDQSVDPKVGFINWDIWLQRQGVTGVDTSRGMRINDSAAVLQTAAEGHGVALIRSAFSKDELATGRLTRLFPNITVISPLAYYVVAKPGRRDTLKIAQFRDWLFSEV